MPVERRSRRLLVLTLAVPVIVAVYIAAAVGRLWSLLRPPVAAVLGASVIGTVYAEHAWRHAPTPVRVAPIRSAGVMAIALVFLSASLPAAPARAADPLEMAIDAARGYIGTPYRLGAEQRNLVDCSGLIYRIFADIGELPRVGGKRLKAMGYYRWFNARGLATKKNPERGDLVVYTGPNHIGIYLGDGKVLSALVSGVKVHDLHGISVKFLAFLKVDYAVGDPAPRPDPAPGDDGAKDGPGKKKPPKPAPEEPTSGGEGAPPPDAEPEAPAGQRGFAVGTMNLRLGADPDARIVGWVRRGSTFEVIGSGNSPSGALWHNVRLANGREGWVYSRWVRTLER